MKDFSETWYSLDLKIYLSFQTTVLFKKRIKCLFFTMGKSSGDYHNGSDQI